MASSDGREDKKAAKGVMLVCGRLRGAEEASTAGAGLGRCLCHSAAWLPTSIANCGEEKWW